MVQNGDTITLAGKNHGCRFNPMCCTSASHKLVQIGFLRMHYKSIWS
jgi:hypothetical protein